MMPILSTFSDTLLVIAVPEDTRDFAPPVEPDEPSNGKFIWATGKPDQAIGPNGNKGSAEFIIDIPEDGKYVIWARVIAWDGGSDSFWVTWEPSDPAENPQVTQNVQFRWSIGGEGQGTKWLWVKVNKWLNGGHFERDWEFEEGATKLTIWTRENATMLDALFITNNLAAVAGDIRLPTDEDRKLQLQSQSAVEAAGKLSTTWGHMKSRYR